MNEMITVLKKKERENNETVDDIQPRKRFRGDDMKPEKHGTIEGQVENSSSDSSTDDEDDDFYNYDTNIIGGDSDDEPNTADNDDNGNNTVTRYPIIIVHTSTQTDDPIYLSEQ